MISVLIPEMPAAEQVRPFLTQIDALRRYTNFGPLNERLETELRFRFTANCALSRPHVVTTSNGTMALELALRAMHLPRGSRVLVPAVTFVATMMAVLNAGLTPTVVDVDDATWQLTPNMAAGWLDNGRFGVSAVIPVAAFGVPVDVASWAVFSQHHRVPVVVDAAGALLSQELSEWPGVTVCFSMHATKFVGAGEGGVVATASGSLSEIVRRLSCFGQATHDVGTNAKLSEYHAAVALASLATSSARAHRHEQLLELYDVQLPLGVTRQSAQPLQSTILAVRLPETAEASAVVLRMLERGIETRQWYRPFLDEHPVGRCYCVGDFVVTERLRRSLVGLPFHIGLIDEDVGVVCETLGDALQQL